MMTTKGTNMKTKILIVEDEEMIARWGACIRLEMFCASA